MNDLLNKRETKKVTAKKKKFQLVFSYMGVCVC